MRLHRHSRAWRHGGQECEENGWISRVLCGVAADPHVPKEVDDSLLPLDDVIARSDLLIVATPHPEFAELVTDKPVVDIWNLLGNYGIAGRFSPIESWPYFFVGADFTRYAGDKNQFVATVGVAF